MDNYLWGIDLSLSNTGITIFDLKTLEPVYIGSFNTKKIYATRQYKGLYLNSIKLYKMGEWMKEIAERYPPSQIAIERGFSRFNNETQVLFRCHGLVNYLFWNVPQEYYPPKTIKEAIYKGNATKPQVQQIIKNNFVDIEFANEDESDSFAIALTYLIKNELINFVKPIVDKKKKKI